MPAKSSRKKKSSVHRIEDDDLEEWKRSRQLIKPKDQIELQDAELKELVPRILTMTNPEMPDNIVEFNYATGEFESIVLPSTYVIAYERKGTYIHKDTEEARAQMIREGVDPALFNDDIDEGVEDDTDLETVTTTTVEDTTTAEEGEGEGEDEGEGHEGEGGEGETKTDDAQGDDADDATDAPKPGKPKKLTNQFNFCERAALTYIFPMRCQETQTVPPVVKKLSGNVLQWTIYDAYLKDFEQQQIEKEKEKERREQGKMVVSKPSGKKSKKKKGLSEAVQARLFESWKVLERMINLNSYDDVAKDFRYWEDPSDEYREDEGTLLPLWKYSYDVTLKHTITYLTWNPWYYDLFVVCFGYLDFMKPLTEGYICLFTIKNPSFPETICQTNSAVMCADIHPKYPYMLVCGLFDGNIQIFNIQASTKKAAYSTKNYESKHSGIVWAIKWVDDLPDGELNFYSVANDGKVNNYVLMQNELAVTTVINLFLEQEATPGPDGTLLRLKACATYIIMHPKDPTIYLVGTEEGNIYKCSVNYSCRYLETYKAHQLPVYKIDYNKYNTDIFVSCSGDWRIKIWEDGRLDPLYVFDLGAGIMDVAWAPYSSTVFAAATSDGKVYVFDLNMNKYKAVCVQPIVSKKRYKLTSIAFNYNLPIIIAGDDKGTVTSLKLSPNLRTPCKPPKKQPDLDQFTMQCMKLDRLLALVREPAVLFVNPDIGSTKS